MTFNIASSEMNVYFTSRMSKINVVDVGIIVISDISINIARFSAASVVDF